VVVLIPAYEPDRRLVDVVAGLRRRAPHWQVLVVDDGSGRAYTHLFTDVAALGATVLTHSTNQGKGAALKTGFAWIMEHAPGEDTVCADSDGQHLIRDVVRVAGAVRPAAMVLGGRRFTGKVPFRSRFGNTVTRHVFRALSGIALYDTQTGLRAYPHELLGWLLSVPGDGFEYEFQALLRARSAGVQIVEVEIETVYRVRENSSHFRALRDSWRIYAPLPTHAWMPRP
jgi:glycosyltransferase involved in cell wall biosynthesis